MLRGRKTAFALLLPLSTSFIVKNYTNFLRCSRANPPATTFTNILTWAFDQYRTAYNNNISCLLLCSSSVAPASTSSFLRLRVLNGTCSPLRLLVLVLRCVDPSSYASSPSAAHGSASRCCRLPVFALSPSRVLFFCLSVYS